MYLFDNWRLLAAASAAITCLAGCGSSGGSTVPPPAVTPEKIDFLLFTNQAFSNSANSSPVSLNLTFNFDADDDPTAFDSLIASGSFGGN